MPSIAVVTSLHTDFNARVWKHCKSLVKRASEVHLICPWKVDAGSIIDGVQMHPFPPVQRRLQRPVLTPLRLMPKLIRILPRVDLVHFHDLDILPWMAILSLVKPVVYDVHENYAEEMLVREWVPDWLRVPLYHGVGAAQYAFAYLLRNVVLVVPDQERQFPGKRFRRHSVRNYASLELLSKVHGDDYESRPGRVVFTGANYESNGSVLLLEIAKRVKTLLPDLRFTVMDWFADRRFREEFLEKRRAWDLEDYVEILPPVPPQEITTILNRSTIALACNLRVAKQEMALPQKLFEYMAAALPIVSSDLPHARQIFMQHDLGILAQPENPDSFVRAIHQLATDRGRARVLGFNGQMAFKTAYCWEGQMDGLWDFYRQILAKAA